MKNTPQSDWGSAKWWGVYFNGALLQSKTQEGINLVIKTQGTHWVTSYSEEERTLSQYSIILILETFIYK